MDRCQMYFEGRANRIPDSFFFLQGLAGSETAVQRRPRGLAQTFGSLSWVGNGARKSRKVPRSGAVSGGGEGRMRGRILLQQVTNQPRGSWALI